MLTSLIAGAVPAWGSTNTRLAEAMRPPLPTAGRRTILKTIVPPPTGSPGAQYAL